jgi:1-acyl-sn-glycerol-3-phosphate acyltransferase
MRRKRNDFAALGLPPIRNHFLYCWRVFGKWFTYFLIGLMSLLMGLIISPVLLLIFHPRERFLRYGRRFISISMHIVLSFLSSLNFIVLRPGDRQRYRELGGKILVANHPDILDIIILFSLIPNADCVVRGNLKHNPLGTVIRFFYILNSEDILDLERDCAASLAQGNCLIIFPEGHRTPRDRPPKLQRGAARISLLTGCPLVTLHIGGNLKYGLGKRDPWTAFHPTEPYIYDFSFGTELSPDNYRDMPEPIAARALTADIEKAIFPTPTQS